MGWEFGIQLWIQILFEMKDLNPQMAKCNNVKEQMHFQRFSWNILLYFLKWQYKIKML